MQSFKIIAQSNIPISEHWQSQLTTLLGSKPRRLSRWCELGLWGALSCLQAQRQFPDDVAIRVYSESGTIAATQAALAQARDYLPMPVTFMQTQPGQLFNALGAALNWHGDGCVISGLSRQQTEIRQLQIMTQATLLAWVDEVPIPVSNYIWLAPSIAPPEADWQGIDSVFHASASARWLGLAEQQLFESV